MLLLVVEHIVQDQLILDILNLFWHQINKHQLVGKVFALMERVDLLLLVALLMIILLILILQVLMLLLLLLLLKTTLLLILLINHLILTKAVLINWEILLQKEVSKICLY